MPLTLSWLAASLAAVAAPIPVQQSHVAPSRPGVMDDPYGEGSADPEPSRKRGTSGAPERPNVRASVMLTSGLYDYTQNAGAAWVPVELLDLTVGRGATESARTAGVRATAQAQVPTVQFLGIDAGLQASRWSVSIAELNSEPVNDWIVDARLSVVAGHSVVVASGLRVHAGARVGGAVDDFVYFTEEAMEADPSSFNLDTDGDGDPDAYDADGDGEADSLGGATVLYQQLRVPSFAMGLQVGADLHRLFGVLRYDARLLDSSGVYSHDLDLDIGVSLTDILTLNGYLGWTTRFTQVYVEQGLGAKTPVGSLSDQQLMAGAGLGVQL